MGARRRHSGSSHRGAVGLGCPQPNRPIKQLYVIPEHRGRGVGSIQVAEILRRAANAGYYR
ncbi:GNAT family N-acetyltransferase [Singulisphaera rosea]